MWGSERRRIHVARCMAKGQAPARRREGVQHVVHSDNKRVTRGRPKCAETVNYVTDATLGPRAVYQRHVEVPAPARRGSPGLLVSVPGDRRAPCASHPGSDRADNSGVVAHDHAQAQRKACGGPAGHDDPQGKSSSFVRSATAPARRLSRARRLSLDRPLVLEAHRGRTTRGEGLDCCRGVPPTE